MRRNLIRYVIIFAGSYLLINLFFSLPPIRKSHADTFRTTMGTTVGSLMPASFIRLEEGEKDNPYLIRGVYNSQANVDAQVEEGRKNRVANFRLDIFELHIDIFILYILPLGFLWSLILASPIPWKRKIFAIVSGTVILYIICILRIWVLMLANMSAEKLGAYQYSEGMTSTLDVVSRMFSPGLIMMLPVLIWIGVSFRKKDWKKVKALLTS